MVLFVIKPYGNFKVSTHSMEGGNVIILMKILTAYEHNY